MAWHAHWRFIVQVLPNGSPMQFNTGLCFIFLGASLFLLTVERGKIAASMGAITTAFAAAIVLQYVTGRDLGLDQFFSTPYFAVEQAFPGRISPLGCVCLIFTGVSIVLSGLDTRWPFRRASGGLLACVVGIVACVSVFGYIFGIEAAYGWGAYSRMSLNSAVMLLCLSSGLLAWNLAAARRENIDFVRWVPVIASVTLLVMIAIVSGANRLELKRATFWRKHTFEVILAAQAFEENLTDIQRGARGFVNMGDPASIVLYKGKSALEPLRLNRLLELTKDSPEQQERIRKLADAMTRLFIEDDKMIRLRENQGVNVLRDTGLQSEARAASIAAVDAVRAISLHEQNLLTARDTNEEVVANKAERLLIAGSAAAGILLVLANLMASRELHERQRIENRLREISALQKAIVASTDYAIIALDPDGVVRTFNPAAERMLGYNAAEVVGKATPMLWRDPAEVEQAAKALSRELGREIKPGVEVLTARSLLNKANDYEVTFVRKDGTRFPVHVSFTTLARESGAVTGFLGVIADITQRKRNEAERERMIVELRAALAEVKTLSGMIPICGWCKSIRSDEGYWQTVEHYVRLHADVTFSHGVCPDCAKKLEAELHGRV